MNGDSATACPLVAAYIAGRQCWVASWTIEQASLLGHSDLADQALADLIAGIGDALPHTADDADEPIEKLIQIKREEWHELLDTLWFAELIIEANDEWQDVRERTDIDREQFRQEACESLLRNVSDIPTAIRNGILRQMDRISALAFQCGECVEQGLRPPKIYRWMKQSPGRDRNRRRDIADRQIAPGEIPPERWWRDDVRAWWTKLDLPMDLLPNFPDRDSQEGAESFAEIVQRIDELVRRALTIRFFGSELERPGYLDLRLDERRRHVFRGGNDADLQKHPLCWELLKVLIRGHGEVVPREEIQNVWREGEIAYAKKPSDGTVYEAISTLRALLKPLRVTIKSVRNRGYRLLEC